MTDRRDDERVEAIQDRLATLEGERRALQSELVSLEHRLPSAPDVVISRATVTAASPSDEKIALFRRLFAGRADVFPLRWQNAGSGKSGYAPACANEWKRGVCLKPQVKCGECPNQAFIPLSDEIVRRHLGGLRGTSSEGATPWRASILCSRTAPVASWPSTSTTTVGRRTRTRISRHVAD